MSKEENERIIMGVSEERELQQEVTADAEVGICLPHSLAELAQSKQEAQ